MNIDNKEFLKYELKPLINDCITYWLDKEYFDEYAESINLDEIDELADVEDCPEDLYDTIYDATFNILDKDDTIDPIKLRTIINKEWIIKRDEFIDKYYNDEERDLYIDNEDYYD